MLVHPSLQPAVGGQLARRGGDHFTPSYRMSRNVKTALAGLMPKDPWIWFYQAPKLNRGTGQWTYFEPRLMHPTKGWRVKSKYERDIPHVAAP